MWLVYVWIMLIGAACSSNEQPRMDPASPAPLSSSGLLTTDEATEYAISSAAHILAGNLPDRTSATLATFGESLIREHMQFPMISRPDDLTPVWTIDIVGAFPYPGNDVTSPAQQIPQEPETCNQVTVLIDAKTGDYYLLSVAPASGCS